MEKRRPDGKEGRMQGFCQKGYLVRTRLLVVAEGIGHHAQIPPAKYIGHKPLPLFNWYWRWCHWIYNSWNRSVDKSIQVHGLISNCKVTGCVQLFPLGDVSLHEIPFSLVRDRKTYHALHFAGDTKKVYAPNLGPHYHSVLVINKAL